MIKLHFQSAKNWTHGHSDILPFIFQLSSRHQYSTNTINNTKNELDNFYLQPIIQFNNEVTQEVKQSKRNKQNTTTDLVHQTS